MDRTPRSSPNSLIIIVHRSRSNVCVIYQWIHVKEGKSSLVQKIQPLPEVLSGEYDQEKLSSLTYSLWSINQLHFPLYGVQEMMECHFPLNSCRVYRAQHILKLDKKSFFLMMHTISDHDPVTVK